MSVDYGTKVPFTGERVETKVSMTMCSGTDCT